MAAAKKASASKLGKKTELLSPEDYVRSLDPERRGAVETLRRHIKRHLPKGYVETMQYGMISYVVPLKTYPAGYLGKKQVPLPYLSLASQKGYLSLYLMGVHSDRALLERFTKSWKRTGKKLDMGKSCLRFKRVEDLALEVLGEAIAALPISEYVARHEAARSH